MYDSLRTKVGDFFYLKNFNNGCAYAHLGGRLIFMMVIILRLIVMSEGN
jgi:hypothetical protein